MDNCLRQEPVYKDFIPEFLEQIETTINDHCDTDDIHVAFAYFIANLFETSRDDKFVYTDGSKDGGIDFFIQDGNTYSIYQCKCPDYDQIEGATKPRTFDKDAVQETITGVNTLLDQTASYDLRRQIARLRTDYQRDLRAPNTDSPVLTVNLAVFGDLSPAAYNLFVAERNRLKEQDIDFNLYTWKDIYVVLHEFDIPETQEIKIELRYNDINKEVLRHDSYFYMLSYAMDFYEAWRKYEWNLFDLNVRLQLYRSQINKRIIASLKRSKSQKIFHHLNNGITITCKSYSFDNANKQIRLVDPQIINGCQTVCAIRDAYEDMTPEEQETFEERTRIQVKVIQTTDPEFISQMVITTNDQNPMAPRNLKSNSVEQKKIQTDFRLLAEKWFYERKEGEWKSFVSSGSKIKWFKKSDYTSSFQKRCRVINNALLAKIWYAWTGSSNKVVQGGIDYFDNDEIYNSIFKSAPNSSFWDEFKTNVYFVPKDLQFSPDTPTIHQYLLSLAAYQVIANHRVSSRQNREEALKRGIQQEKIKVDNNGRIISIKETQDNYLANDDDYRLNIMINNMSDILVELYSFILCKRYGDLDSVTSKKLVDVEEIRLFRESNFSTDFLPNEIQDGTKIFCPIYAFLKYCMKQYSFTYKAEMAAAARLKSYLFNRKVIQQMKEIVIDSDRAIVEYDRPWKKVGKTFLNSLPDL